MLLKEISKNSWLIKGSLVSNFISLIRNKNTNSEGFSSCIKKLSLLLGAVATSNFDLKEEEIETPVAKTTAYIFKNNITIVPVLRAGLPMAEALQSFLPESNVGHIGLYRNTETLDAIKYYEKLPNNIGVSDVIICDPLIATANSLTATIYMVQQYKPKSITVLGIIAAKTGLEKLSETFPNISFYVSAIDSEINYYGYIIPGAGDAGDRIFGTLK